MFVVVIVLSDLQSICIVSRGWLEADPRCPHFTAFGFRLFRRLIVQHPCLRNGNGLFCGGARTSLKKIRISDLPKLLCDLIRCIPSWLVGPTDFLLWIPL